MKRGESLGPITVVKTTPGAERMERLAGLADPAGFPVRIRGLRNGEQVDEVRTVTSVRRALHAVTAWEEVRRIFIDEVDVVVSNTGDTGYDVTDEERTKGEGPPKSFVGKLLALLLERWQANGKPLSVLPCELLSRNGEVLRETVVDLARRRDPPTAFLGWVENECRWANTLVDRIVSEAIHPAGAVAEPYALWAVQKQEGLVLPCQPRGH